MKSKVFLPALLVDFYSKVCYILIKLYFVYIQTTKGTIVATNSSIIVKDQENGLYAYGYQHNNGSLTYQELIESALSINDEWDGSTEKNLTPVEFLAEWHTLSLQKWQNPSDVTIEAIKNLSEISVSDDFHYVVEMDKGYIDSISCFKSDVPVMEIQFA